MSNEDQDKNHLLKPQRSRSNPGKYDRKSKLFRQRSHSTGRDEKSTVDRKTSEKVLSWGGDEGENDKAKVKDKLKKFIKHRPSYSDLENKGIIPQASGGDEEKEKSKVKDKLRTFLKQRPPFSELESKGIIKQTSAVDEGEKDKSKIGNKLSKLFKHRPSYSDLEMKGIIQQEIFGCQLSKLCQREQTNVPNFVTKCIETVDKKGLTLRGIYRECGNASQMHKLRILIDQGHTVNFDDKQWQDVHMIAGTLKWYFRELPVPLIPFDKFHDFVNAIIFPIAEERAEQFKDIVKTLPRVNYETLYILMTHLNRVVQHSSENKMEAQNVGIVFGPTLLRPPIEEEFINIGMNTRYQNQIIQLMLSEFTTIFDQR